MGDFRITISRLDGIDASTLAENIMAAYGEDFDARLGDFKCDVDGERVIVTVLDVTGGDVDMLASDIANDADATFVIQLAQREGASWFPRDEGDDDL
jgi:hypothetical protein